MASRNDGSSSDDEPCEVKVSKKALKGTRKQKEPPINSSDDEPPLTMIPELAPRAISQEEAEAIVLNSIPSQHGAVLFLSSSSSTNVNQLSDNYYINLLSMCEFKDNVDLWSTGRQGEDEVPDTEMTRLVKKAGFSNVSFVRVEVLKAGVQGGVFYFDYVCPILRMFGWSEPNCVGVITIKFKSVVVSI